MWAGLGYVFGGLTLNLTFGCTVVELLKTSNAVPFLQVSDGSPLHRKQASNLDNMIEPYHLSNYPQYYFGAQPKSSHRCRGSFNLLQAHCASISSLLIALQSIAHQSLSQTPLSVRWLMLLGMSWCLAFSTFMSTSRGEAERLGQLAGR